jgi:Domain of unknown function (DUF1707)
MSTAVLDPQIHNPRRLRILATLAALPAGDTLSIARLRDMAGLPEGSPAPLLPGLARAGYIEIGQAGEPPQPAAALTRDGRAALARYTAMLRQLARDGHRAPALSDRAGDADRDAAAAALGEHFAQGRLSFDELSVRLDATLTATTHGDLHQAARDLPGPALLSAPAGLPQGKRPAIRAQIRAWFPGRSG